MVILLTLYEDWLPFLLAAAYVVFHHGTVGTLDQSSVYNHPEAIAHPWRWAAVHGLFITAAGRGRARLAAERGGPGRRATGLPAGAGERGALQGRV
jgi:hypothetical protein